MKIFRPLAVVLMLAMCGVAAADDYNYLIVQKKSAAAAVESFSINDFTTITVSSGKMNLLNGTTGVASIDIADIRKMILSETTTAIRDLTAAEGEAGVEVYNMQGQFVGIDTDLNLLPKGVYIIRKGQTAHKVIRR